MDAMSNTDTVETLDSGLIPSTIPGGCKDAQNGVSVENMPERKDGYEWYVFRASYGRAAKAAEFLTILGVTSYIALHTVYKTKGGKRKRAIAPLIPGIIFAYLTEADAELVTKGLTSSSVDVAVVSILQSKNANEKAAIGELNKIISYYYDHFRIDEHTRKNPPLTIPSIAMENFIKATSSHKDVMPVEPREFNIGEEVKVVNGEFAGLVGKVIQIEKGKKRLKVQLTDNNQKTSSSNQNNERRRLLFQLPSLGSFCSASIPVEYFSKIK